MILKNISHIILYTYLKYKWNKMVVKKNRKTLKNFHLPDKSLYIWPLMSTLWFLAINFSMLLVSSEYQIHDFLSSNIFLIRALPNK